MQLIIDVPDALGKQIQSLDNHDEMIRKLLEEIIESHRHKQREELLQDLRNFQPFKVKKDTTQVLREEREKLDTHGQGYISCYDAIFHALAIEEHALLLTADKKHYKTRDSVGSIVLLTDLVL